MTDKTLTDPDDTFGDDSDFVAGLLATDTGSGDDSGFTHGPVIGDTGAGDDSAVTVAVAVPLAEASAGDDLPWQYLSSRDARRSRTTPTSLPLPWPG